jgi:hypothetical protein
MLRLKVSATVSGYRLMRSLAVSPTYTFPSSSTLTTEGVRFFPSLLGMIFGPSSVKYAIKLLVVPKSIPTIIYFPYSHL